MHRRGLVLFAAVSLVWGLPYLLVKIAVDDGVPVLFVTFVRVALAAAVLVPLLLRGGRLRALRGRWRAVALYATCELLVPFPLITFGLERVSSSLAAILVAAVPLGVALLALRFDAAERVDGVRLAGLVVGLGGLLLLLGVDVAGDGAELVGALAILVAALSYAAGSLVIKRGLGDTDPAAAVAGACLLATAVFAVPGVLAAPAEVPSAGSLGALVAVALVCTALGFLLYFLLVHEVGPSRASVITYVNPVVAVALGVTFLGESLTGAAVAGLLLVLAGSWVATGGGRPPGGSHAIRALRATVPLPRSG